MNAHLIFRAASAFVIASIVGCGGSATGDVSGTVTYRGKPVRMGTVMLLSSAGTPHYADLKDDGSFTVMNIPLGQVRATVSSPDPARPMIAKGETIPKHGPPDPRWFALPPRFADPGKSGLQFDVSRSGNAWDIRLE